jgi:heme A synthase
MPSRRYRRLALSTVVATFALIVIGGIVRISDSGLGCGPAGSGLHGWPLCRGDVVPGLDPHEIVEYAHRAAASTVALLLIALCVLAWRRYRAQRGIVVATTAGVALVIAQGLLGAATVEKNLDEPLVAAHLGMAMLLLALALYVWRASRPGVAGSPRARVGRGVRALAGAAQASLLGAIVAGGYMAGTHGHGRPVHPMADAHEACGHSFPGCRGGFLPFGSDRLVDIQLTHRALVYATTLLLLALFALVARRRGSGLGRATGVVAAVLAVQLLLGALNVWLEESAVLIVAHLTTATLLWGSLTLLNLRLYRIPAPAAARASQPAAVSPGAVTA